jgi:carboxypeptidase C (cathepsin A)
MLFIDQPTTTGFSYSKAVPAYLGAENFAIDSSGNYVITLPNNTCPDYAQNGDDETVASSCGTYSLPDVTLTANTTLNAADNFWKTLQGFMGAFPQYSRDGFIFTTESYGGHYAPIFNQYFLEQNEKNILGAHKINLTHVTIGNGWYVGSWKASDREPWRSELTDDTGTIL